MTSVDLAGALATAESLALEAGAELMAMRASLANQPPERKGRRELVTAADRAAERTVVAGLQRAFPEHAVCAEEGVLTPRGKPDHDGDWLWHIDPIDGTANFVHGIPFWAVALSLSRRAEPLVGVVHAPELGSTFCAVRGAGARQNGRPMAVTTTRTLADGLIATGFSYRRDDVDGDDNLARVARVLPRCRDLRRLGSAQLDLCLTAAGCLDGYWEVDLQSYDMVAGALIVREAGGRVTDLAGEDDWLNRCDIVASNGWLHDELLACLVDRGAD